jgi:hypothetical protein
MSIIPTIFNESLPAYTVVGGREPGADSGISAILLNRGGRHSRRVLFQDFEKNGFDYVISVESARERYDVEELSGRFPFVRFILLPEGISPGEQINLAAAELSGPFFFVLWNDLRFISGGGTARMAERLYLNPGEQRKEGPERSALRRLCTVPLILNSRFETLPTLINPAVMKKSVTTSFSVPRTEGRPSLYAFDGVGVYDRDRFIRLGGFDSSMKSFHWQLMDFGFRSWLWGEEIAATKEIKLFYDGEAPAENNTAEESYLRFYLKNLAPVFRGDYANLPLRKFPAYLFRAGGDPFGAWEDFSEGRRWVRTNMFRFSRDARTLMERWGNGDGEP